MKLFLWRDVLCDYTCGMAFAIASSADEARELIMRDCDCSYARVGDFIKDPEVHELTESFAATVWGGA